MGQGQLPTGTKQKEAGGEFVLLQFSELGLDKNCYERWGWKHRYMFREEKATGSCGLSMSGSIMPTLVIPHAGDSPHK